MSVSPSKKVSSPYVETVQFASAPAAAETPSTPTRKKYVVVQPHTPLSKIHLPPGAILGSPAKYHDPRTIDRWSKDGKPNKELRKYLKQLESKAVDSTTLGSATKDPETIIRKRKTPDEHGCIEVTPTHPGARKRVWKVHPEATTDRKIHRMYPVEGTGILRLAGKDKAELIRGHLKEKENLQGNCGSFEEHLRKRIRFTEHPLDTPEKPNASAVPLAVQQPSEEYKPKRLLFS
jgi:hypothetical protein